MWYGFILPQYIDGVNQVIGIKCVIKCKNRAAIWVAALLGRLEGLMEG